VRLCPHVDVWFLCVTYTQAQKETQERDGAWRKERKKIGKTAEGRYVDGESHRRLVEGLGYDRCVGVCECVCLFSLR